MPHASKAAALTTLQRIGAGLTNIGKIFAGRKWDQKIQNLQVRAALGDESASNLLNMMGLTSIIVGTAGGLGAAKLLGAKGRGLALGTATGSLLGTLPLAAVRERAPAVTLPGFDMDRKAAADRIQTGSTTMLKAGMGADLLKLDAKGVSLPALQSLYGRDIEGALQHPGIMALIARRKERIRRLSEELKQPGSHLKQEEPKTPEGMEELGMPLSHMPMAPGGPAPPSNHMGLLGGGMPGMAAGGMPTKIGVRVDAYLDKSAEGATGQEDQDEAREALGHRVEAYKYGFFVKFAELGKMPSELCELMEKQAGMLPFLAGQTTARAAGRAGEEAGGLARWLAGTAGRTAVFGLKLPIWLALLGGTGAGVAYRMMTAPGYAEPGKLRQTEQLSLYRRLGREAQLRAKRLQAKRIARTGAKEPTVKVPEIEAA